MDVLVGAGVLAGADVYVGAGVFVGRGVLAGALVGAGVLVGVLGVTGELGATGDVIGRSVTDPVDTFCVGMDGAVARITTGGITGEGCCAVGSAEAANSVGLFCEAIAVWDTEALFGGTLV